MIRYLPSFFVLYLEDLTYLILDKVDKGYWDGIKTGRNGPIVSHLMFADDLLIFGKAKEKKIQKMHKVLDKFCGISGIVPRRIRSHPRILFIPKKKENDDKTPKRMVFATKSGFGS